MSSRRKQHKPNRVQFEAGVSTTTKAIPEIKSNVFGGLALIQEPLQQLSNDNVINEHSNSPLPQKINCQQYDNTQPLSMDIDPVVYYSADDPSRRNKRGNRGTGKVQPRQLDSGEQVFPCPACDKEGKELFLTSREELTGHLRTHNKPIETGGGHVCAICARELSSQSSLDRHMLTHSDERPYACPLCPTSFTTNGNMRRHLSTHKSDPNLMEEVNRYLSSDKRRKRSRNSLETMKMAMDKSKMTSTPISQPNFSHPPPSAVGNGSNFYQWLNSSFSMIQKTQPQPQKRMVRGELKAVLTNKTLPMWKSTSAPYATSMQTNRAPVISSSLASRLAPNSRAYFCRSQLFKCSHRLRAQAIVTLTTRKNRAFSQNRNHSQRVHQVLEMIKRRERYRGRRQSSNILTCELCDRQCVGKKSLVVHRAVAHDTPAGKTIYCCLGRYEDGQPCQEKDEDLSSIKRHIMINHVKIDPFICKLCNPNAVLNVGLNDTHLHKQPGSFCTKENVYRHLMQKKNHEMIADLKTKLDPSRFKLFVERVKVELTGVVQIREDVRQRYIGDESTSCVHCQIDYKTGVALHQHLSSHPKCKTMHSCHCCSIDVPTKEMLVEHLRIKHNEHATNEDISISSFERCVRSSKMPVTSISNKSELVNLVADQPLDLSFASNKSIKKKCNNSVVNDSGISFNSSTESFANLSADALLTTQQLTQQPLSMVSGNAAAAAALINSWCSPLWTGLYPGLWTPQQQQALYLHQLSQLTANSMSNDSNKLNAVVSGASDQLKLLKASTPVESQYISSSDDLKKVPAKSAAAGIIKLDYNSLHNGSSASIGRDENDIHLSSSGESGDESPAKKRAKKKNSYKDAPNLIYCPFQSCTQSFPWMSSLKRHIITHTNHKPYCCTRCTQSFSTKSNRERHMERIHHIKIKGNLSASHLTTDELSTFTEHDKVAEKIGEELLKQLGHSVVTSVNPQRLNRTDSMEDTDDSALGISMVSTYTESQYQCPECGHYSTERLIMLNHIRRQHADLWLQLSSKYNVDNTEDILTCNSTVMFEETESECDDNSKESYRKSVLCSVCCKHFASLENLQRHHMQCHVFNFVPFSTPNSAIPTDLRIATK